MDKKEMNLEEVEDQLKKLQQERCDCVLSIRNPTTCFVCRDIDFYTELRNQIRIEMK
jgi:hypothetical protein